MVRISGVLSYPGFELSGSNCTENCTQNQGESKLGSSWREFESFGVLVTEFILYYVLTCFGNHKSNISEKIFSQY